MSEQQFLKYVFRLGCLWMLGSLISYGHIAKQMEAEDRRECQVRRAADPKAWCDNSADFAAWGISIMSWPYHWSRELWK